MSNGNIGHPWTAFQCSCCLRWDVEWSITTLVIPTVNSLVPDQISLSRCRIITINTLERHFPNVYRHVTLERKLLRCRIITLERSLPRMCQHMIFEVRRLRCKIISMRPHVCGEIWCVRCRIITFLTLIRLFTSIYPHMYPESAHPRCRKISLHTLEWLFPVGCILWVTRLCL